MGEDEIMMLRPETIEALQQDENYFRARKIFSIPQEDVGTFSIEIGKARTDLAVNEKGFWEFIGDADRRVDQEQVAIRLESLLRARVQQFVEMNPRDLNVYGLQPPKFRFTVTSRDKARTEGVEIGRSETGNVMSSYARRRGDNSIFTMELSSELVILPENVADKRFAWVHPDRIDHFDIEIGEQKYSFKLENGEWQMLRPTQTAYSTADAAKVQRFLSIMNEIEYEKDYSASGDTVIAPTDAPSMVARHFGQGDAQLLEMVVGKRLQSTSFVKLDGERTYEVPNTQLDALQAAAKSLVQ
jgi:hypothetical protein